MTIENEQHSMSEKTINVNHDNGNCKTNMLHTKMHVDAYKTIWLYTKLHIDACKTSSSQTNMRDNAFEIDSCIRSCMPNFRYKSQINHNLLWYCYHFETVERKRANE